ncbi:hypothetical protein B0H10DRAFT_1950418 [Mycena sp. CBHHK59/15]|nr:hypothetical protein B0H10DRAFT_1950418 [Mycena sp. CBHHK59/15]
MQTRSTSNQGQGPPFTQATSPPAPTNDQENIAPPASAGSPFSAGFKANRPSPFWMKYPSWIDGACDPLLFFTSREQIDQTLEMYRDFPAQSSPTPASCSSVLGSSALSNLSSNTSDSSEPAANSPLANAGHLVFVTVAYSAPLSAPSA